MPNTGGNHEQNTKSGQQDRKGGDKTRNASSTRDSEKSGSRSGSREGSGKSGQQGNKKS